MAARTNSRGQRRRRNPAELVLLGANPMKVKRYAILWKTGNISQAFTTEGEAQKMLDRFHGVGRMIRVNPMPLGRSRRSNPGMVDEARARDIHSGFVDADSRTSWYASEPHMPAGNYALLGKDESKLSYLAIKPVGGGPVLNLDLEDRDILVLAATTRTQLWFAQGDQRMSDSDLDRFDAGSGDVVELGECRQIGYLAIKYHIEAGNDAAGKVVLWDHPFEAPLPHVFYDRAKARLLLKGGGYRVEDAGIVG